MAVSGSITMHCGGSLINELTLRRCSSALKPVRAAPSAQSGLDVRLSCMPTDEIAHDLFSALVKAHEQRGSRRAPQAASMNLPAKVVLRYPVHP
jgi:hypothetical protein